jgi:hypothetical protein
MRRILTLALVLAASASLAARADEPPMQETPQTSLSVVARDPQGAPLPGVAVTLSRPSASYGEADSKYREWIDIADRLGRVHFEGLARGKYEILLQLSGFMDMRLGPFELQYLKGRDTFPDGLVEVVMIPLSLCHGSY